MQNDVLKNEIAPWQEKGRWYHGLWDGTLQAFDPNESDDYLLNGGFSITTISNVMYIFPPNSYLHPIIDVKLFPHEMVAIPSTANFTVGSRRASSSGGFGIAFMQNTITSKIDVWFFVK